MAILLEGFNIANRTLRRMLNYGKIFYSYSVLNLHNAMGIYRQPNTGYAMFPSNNPSKNAVNIAMYIIE